MLPTHYKIINHYLIYIINWFQIWLIRNKFNIPDYDEILCENIQYKLKVIKMVFK